MKFTMLFLLGMLCVSTLNAVDISDIENLELLAMDSKDAFADVLTLFDQLEAQSRGELEQIRADWVVQGNALQETCNAMTGIYGEKVEAYTAQEGVVAGVEAEIEENNNHIDWIDQRVQDNVDKLDSLKQKRCDANLLFVQHLTEHKQSLAAVRTLKQILEGLTEDELLGNNDATAEILAQLGIHKHSKHDTQVLKDVYNKLQSFLNIAPNKIQTSFVELSSKNYIDPDFNMLNDATEQIEEQEYFAPKNFAVQNNNFEDEDAALDAADDALAEDRDDYGEGFEDYQADTHTRTEDQIGDEHVDDQMGEMTMRELDTGDRNGFSSLQQQILGLLDNLELHLEESMTRMTEDEIEASSAFADWKILTENEEAQLAYDRQNNINELKQLDITLLEEQGNLETAGQQRSAAEVQMNTACNAYDTAEQQFFARETNKLEEIDLFGEVRWKYEQMADGLDEQMRQRINEGVSGEEMTDYDRQVGAE